MTQLRSSTLEPPEANVFLSACSCLIPPPTITTASTTGLRPRAPGPPTASAPQPLGSSPRALVSAYNDLDRKHTSTSGPRAPPPTCKQRSGRAASAASHALPPGSPDALLLIAAMSQPALPWCSALATSSFSCMDSPFPKPCPPGRDCRWHKPLSTAQTPPS
jgi:hypothetical protein